MHQSVWEWCKNVWYSNVLPMGVYAIEVWEWCKNVWYSNNQGETHITDSVWEWCKNVWYSNCSSCPVWLRSVWEWCKNVWYSNNDDREHHKHDVWEWCKNAWYSNTIWTVSICQLVWEWWVLNTLEASPDMVPFENDVRTYSVDRFGIRSVFEYERRIWKRRIYKIKKKPLYVRWRDHLSYGGFFKV